MFGQNLNLMTLNNDQDISQPLFMYHFHRLLFLTQVLFLQIFLLHNVRFVYLFSSILSYNRVRYKNSHSSINYCDC